MINYNPKDWLRSTFRFHRADTFRQLFPLLLVVCVYSFAVALIEMEWLHLPDSHYLKNIPVMHSLLGFAISMLLVFRTNTAYDRWWEGRKLWGALVNNSRNLALKIATMFPEHLKSEREFFRKIIPAYAHALHHHLHADKTRIALFDEEDHPSIKKIDNGKHIPNQVAKMMYDHIYRCYKSGIIDGNELIVLNAELQSFTDICGACERIKNTPIPFSYSVFIKKFIFIYVATLPIGYVFSLHYWMIPVVGIVFYVLASLELIAEEIEDPFSGDANDVPTLKISQNIHRHVDEILA